MSHQTIPPNVCSADHYFIKDGKYNFDPFKLGEAHAYCMRKFVSLITTGMLNAPDTTVMIMRGIPGAGKSTVTAQLPDTENFIVVDNTNINVAEVAPYAALAMAYGFSVEVVTVQCDPVTAAARNIHEVPLASVQNMADRIVLSDVNEYWPPYWTRRTVFPQKAAAPTAQEPCASCGAVGPCSHDQFTGDKPQQGLSRSFCE